MHGGQGGLKYLGEDYLQCMGGGESAVHQGFALYWEGLQCARGLQCTGGLVCRARDLECQGSAVRAREQRNHCHLCVCRT